MSNYSKGILFALVTAVISGVSVFVNKFAVTAISQPLVFATVKNAGVALLVFAFILASGKLSIVKTLSKRDLVLLLIIGIVGGSVPFYLFFTGLMTIPAINGALIHKTLVFWVALLALPLLKERLSKKQFLGVALLFGANLIVGGFKGFKLSTGELMVLIATLLWAVENVIAKKVLPRVDSDVVALARMGFGALVLFAFSIVSQPVALSKVLTLSITQLGWVAITTALLFGYVTTWYRALKFAPATTVAAVLVSATLITNILSAALTTHTWNQTLTLQAIIMVAGLVLLGLMPKKSLATK